MNNFNSTPEIKKRVALYLRVSTDAQEERGHGLDVQKDKLVDYCKRLDYLVEEKNIYIDGGYSGSLPIHKRPALQKLFEDAEKKEFEIVIAYKLDRFFRSIKHLISAVDKLNELKIKFRSSSENIENESTSGELMFHMIASFAQHERRLIAERMSGGRERVAKEGKWVTGVPPFGYKVNKDKFLEIVPEEAKIVRQFYEWLVFEKLPLREIVRRANEMKFQSPKHKKEKKVSPTNYWWKRTINRILVNEVYTGDFYFRKHKQPFKYLEAHNENNQRPPEDWISIKVPPIITKEMFQASLNQLRKNQNDCKRNTKRAYMYSKLLYCGYSGKKLQSGYQSPKVNKKSLTLGKYYHTYVRESSYN